MLRNKFVPKMLLESVGTEVETVSASGGVVPRGVVPIEPGDLRELLAFSGSAECWRLSCNYVSVEGFSGIYVVGNIP